MNSAFITQKTTTAVNAEEKRKTISIQKACKRDNWFSEVLEKFSYRYLPEKGTGKCTSVGSKVLLH